MAALLAGAVLLDRLARPRPVRALLRPGRSLPGLWLLTCMTMALFGLFIAVCGNLHVASILTLALAALLILASNAKYAMLGEPLLFSDLALIGAVFRHPQFYLSALRPWQHVAIGLAAAALTAVIAWFFLPDLQAHLAGVALLVAFLALLAFSMRLPPFRHLARTPDAYTDVYRLGLLPSLLVYWLRWRESDDPPPCATSPAIAEHCLSAGAPELIVVIQCESFADPVELFDDPGHALPGLAAARNAAWQWGKLQVSGFGAYTMRTEYGVLFGRSEEALGFRRYDPFLTALGEASYALPARLMAHGWRSLFVHPHDMRFYGRDRIMPAGGFAELLGEDRFAPPAPHEGRYVTDAAMADRIAELAQAAQVPSMIYGVTIENHGPWASRGGRTGADLVHGYLRLLRNSDAMLAALQARLAELGRPAMLVFFGDHRPSIPGASTPGGARHTPYVMIRFDAAGRVAPGDNREVDLSPAELHHAMLDVVLGSPITGRAG